MVSRRVLITGCSALVVVVACGDGETPAQNGGSNGNGTGNGTPIQLQVPTMPEVEEDCAGTFDTSAPPLNEPATFVVDGARAVVRGTLGPTTPDRLQAALDANPGLRTLVLAYVPGTVNAVRSQEAALLARSANLATCVPDTGYIASGGVDLFLAGAVRDVGRSTQGVVVHGWITEQCLPTGECPASPEAEGCVVGADVPRDDPQHLPFVDYYRQIGVDPEWYWWTFDQAPDFCDPLFMDANDLATWGLETTNACTDAPAGAICNVPRGEFTETCRGCFFDEPILSCECDGGAGISSIDVRTCSDGPIDNCGGELACGDCEQVPLDLFQIEWDAPVDLDLSVTDPLGRVIRPDGANDTPNCAASADATGGPGSVEAVGCDAPLAGLYSVRVEQESPSERRDFTFISSRPTAGPISAPYSVLETKDISVLVSEALEVELRWTIHQNLELILVDEDTRRAVTPHGTMFDPLPGCTTSVDNTGADITESFHRETVSCTGLEPGNYQVEVQNPGGGVVFNVGYTVSIGDGAGSAVEISSRAAAATRNEHDLVALGVAGVLDDVECTTDAQCDQPPGQCRVAVCTEANQCVDQNAAEGRACDLGGGALGGCRSGACRP